MSPAYTELEAIYREVPSLPCAECGNCCTSPHLTVTEFAYLLQTMTRRLTTPEIREIIQAQSEAYSSCTGEYRCALLDGQGRCLVYAGRGLGCRLGGFPVLRTMGFPDVISCETCKQSEMASLVTAREVDDWIVRIFDLHQRDLPIEEPYFLDALPLDCWWAVLFDPAIKQEVFLQARALLQAECDCEPFADAYVDQTGLAAMLGGIDRFFAENERRNAPEAAEAIRSVLEDFPRTGSYFRHPGSQYAALMDEVLRQDTDAQTDAAQ